MTALEEIKKALEGVSSAFNRVLAEAPAESDHYSIGFDCQSKAIRINLQDMRTIAELLSTIESLQRENDALKNLIDGDNCADPDKIDALFRRAEAAEAEVKRLTESRDGYKRGRDSIQSEYDRLRASHSAEVETLDDKINGLSADLDSAVGVAFSRGAHEWVRMNYPDRFEKLSRQALASTGGEHNGN